MKIQMKLVTADEEALFEERLARLLKRLPEGAVVVDVAFSTCAYGERVNYSALVHLQVTESWS